MEHEQLSAYADKPVSRRTLLGAAGAGRRRDRPVPRPERTRARRGSEEARRRPRWRHGRARRSPRARRARLQRRPSTSARSSAARRGASRSAGTAGAGRRDLPGEHGFRFFPGFYHHVPDTMRRIPFAGNADGVGDNLVATNLADTWFYRANGRADGTLFGALPHPAGALTPGGLQRILLQEILKTQDGPTAGGHLLRRPG